MTDKTKIREWLEIAKKGDHEHMIVLSDTDKEIYPIYLDKDVDVEKYLKNFISFSTQKVLEVYDLRKNLESQIQEETSFNL